MWQAERDLTFDSADGALRFEQRIERWSLVRDAALYGRRLIVTESATGSTLLDTSDWPIVEAINRNDGRIDLRFSLFLEGSDVFFRIDSAAGTFRDVGMTGPPQPLSALQSASRAAYADIVAFTAWNYDDRSSRYISRDGKLRVHVHKHEPERALHTSSTAIFDTETGNKVADLDDPNWSSWLHPTREEISGLGVLAVNDLKTFAYADFILTPHTMTYRAREEHAAAKPISTLRETVAKSLKVDAEARARNAWHTARSGFDQAVTLFVGIVLGAFLGAIGFALHMEYQKRKEPPRLIAPLPDFKPRPTPEG